MLDVVLVGEVNVFVFALALTFVLTDAVLELLCLFKLFRYDWVLIFVELLFKLWWLVFVIWLLVGDTLAASPSLVSDTGVGVVVDALFEKFATVALLIWLDVDVEDDDDEVDLFACDALYIRDILIRF